MTGTPEKSPMSGTVTSVAVAVVTTRVPFLRRRAGLGLSGSMPYRVIASATAPGRDGAVGGQLGQRGQRDVAAVDLEVLAQHPAVVRAAVAVGAQHPVPPPAGQVGADLLGERPHVVGRGDHRPGRAAAQLLLHETHPALTVGGHVGVQQVPPVGVAALAAQFGEAGAAPHVRGHPGLGEQVRGGDHLAQDGAGAQQLHPRPVPGGARPGSRYMPADGCRRRTSSSRSSGRAGWG